MARKPSANAKPDPDKQAKAAKAAVAVAAKARTRKVKKEPLAQEQGFLRAVIERVTPQVDCGRFPAKRVLGDEMTVEADVFADGHDRVAADLLYRHESERSWHRLPMQALGNDRWQGRFKVDRLGQYRYTLVAWIDHFGTWRQDLEKRRLAGQDLRIDFAIGAGFVCDAASRADEEDAARLLTWAEMLERQDLDADRVFAQALDPQLELIVRRYPDPATVVRLDRELAVVVDRERARFSSWYEFFPRSCSAEPDRHGTFKDAEAMLPYVAGMGFDVVYFPPIHPIGEAFRKGRNNAVTAEPGEVGSPWAIGAKEGGHKAVHPDLGTLEDFRAFIAKAREHDIDIALDIAFQVSPDHPYVSEYPEWFLMRPDGTIQYAENPPKKYQDIYPFHFETVAWPALWQELKSIFEFWIEQGVRIFRVDNPHTKSFRFWEWCINELKQAHPDLILLSEAFTRPKVMHRLAKLGFSQSYTYFTWRNTKQELIAYFTELSQEDSREYFRPNAWPNTPDILHDYLQVGGRPAFVVRFVLAATLAANYGIYGPAFELGERLPREAGSEEYLDSEKYQLRQWDLDDPSSLKELITRVNRIRHYYPALQHDWGLRFHEIDNEQLLAYSKCTEEGTDALLMVVNLDVQYDQSGWLTLPLEYFGLRPDDQYQVEDLLTGERYLWQGPTNYIALSPRGQSAHIFRLHQPVRKEHDFQGYG